MSGLQVAIKSDVSVSPIASVSPATSLSPVPLVRQSSETQTSIVAVIEKIIALIDAELAKIKDVTLTTTEYEAATTQVKKLRESILPFDQLLARSNASLKEEEKELKRRLEEIQRATGAIKTPSVEQKCEVLTPNTPSRKPTWAEQCNSPAPPKRSSSDEIPKNRDVFIMKRQPGQVTEFTVTLDADPSYGIVYLATNGRTTWKVGGEIRIDADITEMSLDHACRNLYHKGFCNCRPGKSLPPHKGYPFSVPHENYVRALCKFATVPESIKESNSLVRLILYTIFLSKPAMTRGRISKADFADVPLSDNLIKDINIYFSGKNNSIDIYTIAASLFDVLAGVFANR